MLTIADESMMSKHERWWRRILRFCLVLEFFVHLCGGKSDCSCVFFVCAESWHPLWLLLHLCVCWFLTASCAYNMDCFVNAQYSLLYALKIFTALYVCDVDFCRIWTSLYIHDCFVRLEYWLFYAFTIMTALWVQDVDCFVWLPCWLL